MHIALRRLAAGILRIAINVLPDPDGHPRPPTIAQLARRSDPVKIRLNERSLDYRISQQELAHIFRPRSNAYQVAVSSRAIEIRSLAGYNTSGNHQEVHGHGATKVVYGGKQLNLYINENLMGIFSGTGSVISRMKNAIDHVCNTIVNIPKALVSAKALKGLVVKAHDHEEPGSLCEIAIVAQTPVVSDDPRRVVFIIQAEQMRGHNTDHPVILRQIFRPVVDGAGQVTGTQRIDPASPDAEREVLRFLIFSKLLMNQMLSSQPIDIAGNLKSVANLPLDKNAKIRDYLSFQPPA
ncbi:MAG: hypothetical protein HYS17_09115 [Micavibrio aeruginosavorus]|uniref:Uncharacterized protein n=1 Tax=Micavibrio aeruginosavorus TaxID=349221 RepID=A0A7T5R188_9BACT|nr:MAG: hypothetical protein HYS17_09115 [Micavibrio aeruginosavorus]